MKRYIDKIWWYYPNAYTTTMVLTAYFADGSSSVYNFNKEGESWVADRNNDSRLVITLPTSDDKRFYVRAYSNDPFDRLACAYSNETSSGETQGIDLSRIVFPVDEFDNSSVFYGFTADQGTWQPWSLFNPDDLSDIFITNITQGFKLPDKLHKYGPWAGWGLLNETVPMEQIRPRANNLKWMPCASIISEHDEGFPRVNQSKVAEIISSPCVGKKYKLLPLYNDGAGQPIWYLENKDYREE